jgi:hypothetical protein
VTWFGNCDHLSGSSRFGSIPDDPHASQFDRMLITASGHSSRCWLQTDELENSSGSRLDHSSGCRDFAGDQYTSARAVGGSCEVAVPARASTTVEAPADADTIANLIHLHCWRRRRS